jgi:hypothetical protein
MGYCQYEKVIKTGSIAENYKINSGCPRLGRAVTTIALSHTWNHFQVTPISLTFALGGVDKFISSLAFLCIPWFAAVDMFFEHTLGPAVVGLNLVNKPSHSEALLYHSNVGETCQDRHECTKLSGVKNHGS